MINENFFLFYLAGFVGGLVAGLVLTILAYRNVVTPAQIIVGLSLALAITFLTGCGSSYRKFCDDPYVENAPGCEPAEGRGLEHQFEIGKYYWVWDGLGFEWTIGEVTAICDAGPKVDVFGMVCPFVIDGTGDWAIRSGAIEPPPLPDIAPNA